MLVTHGEHGLDADHIPLGKLRLSQYKDVRDIRGAGEVLKTNSERLDYRRRAASGP